MRFQENSVNSGMYLNWNRSKVNRNRPLWVSSGKYSPKRLPDCFRPIAAISVPESSDPAVFLAADLRSFYLKNRGLQLREVTSDVL